MRPLGMIRSSTASISNWEGFENINRVDVRQVRVV
jgi:hypothetical protein